MCGKKLGGRDMLESLTFFVIFKNIFTIIISIVAAVITASAVIWLLIFLFFVLFDLGITIYCKIKYSGEKK